MADIQNQMHVTESDLTPGTFLLIRGKYSRKPARTPSDFADDEVPTRSERVVMLDPIPSNDPNEPLVSHPEVLKDR